MLHIFRKVDELMNKIIDKVAGFIAAYIEARQNGNSRRVSLMLAVHDGEWSEPVAISKEEAAEALKGAIRDSGFDLAEIIDNAEARRVNLSEIQDL